MAQKNVKRDGRVNIYDISERAGVSIATVSRVLNGSREVSEKTRAKITAVMKEMGYQPNVFARGLGLDSMATIGLLCADASDAFLSAGVYHTERELRECGYSTILACTGYQPGDKREAMETLLARRIDGAILIGSHFVEAEEKDRAYIREAAKRIPLVLVNGAMEGSNIYCVCCTDFQAAFDVTDRLLRKGRRHPLYIYCASTYSAIQKLNGFRAALGAHGIQPDDSHMMLVSRDILETTERLAALADSGVKWDAVVAGEDICAVPAMKLAAARGLRVPEDLDVIGYNNSLLALCTVPEMSSVDNHVQRLSQQAAAQLIRRLRGEEVEPKVMVPCDLVQRGSSRI